LNAFPGATIAASERFCPSLFSAAFLIVRDGDPTGGTTTGGLAVHGPLGTHSSGLVHIHDHGPVAPPFTGFGVAVPLLQRLAPVGAVDVVVPLAVPHTPGVVVGGTTTTGTGALHELFVPPLLPLHVHDHGFVPPPVTTLAVPGLQRFVVGAVAVVTPLAVPQSPLTLGGMTTGFGESALQRSDAGLLRSSEQFHV
jgi:hypothetical protein